MRLSPELVAKCLALADETGEAVPSPAPSRKTGTVGPARVRLDVWIPGLILRSEANVGGRRREAIARKMAVKAAVRAMLPAATLPFAVPVRVRFVRVGRKKLDDDNLAHCFKAARDAVADWLGVDDGDTAAVRWSYRQRPGWKAGVRIVAG